MSQYFDSRASRLIKKIVYSSVKGLSQFCSRNYFLDLRVRGLKNLKQGGILALNHCIKPAGVVVASVVPSKVHYLVQYEGIFNKGYGKFLRAMEQIPVRFDTEGLREMRDYSMHLLKAHPEDYLGIFIDGSSFSEMSDLRERRSYRGVYTLARRLNKPVIPVATYVDPITFEESNNLGRGFFKNFLWHLSYPKIPYGVSFGKPIYLEDLGRDDLVLKVKREQITLYNKLECEMAG